jgi:hypothetical protein
MQCGKHLKSPEWNNKQSVNFIKTFSTSNILLTWFRNVHPREDY